MESYTVNICQKKKGSIWQNRTRVTGVSPFLCILSELPDQFHSKCHKCARIVHAVIEETGSRILIGDQHGNIYVFDLKQNVFWLLCKLGCCCSALSFTPLEERDILIATSDCKLHLLESASGTRIAKLSGHETCIFHISVDAEGHRALTCSLNAAFLWDLLTLTALQQLAIEEGLTIIDAFFIGAGEGIITALNGDVISLWDATTVDHVFNYKMLAGNDVAIKSITASFDGRYLAACGRTNWILLWEIISPDKPQVMTVSRNISSVRQIMFFSLITVPKFSGSHFLLILNHNGFLHLYCVETGESVLVIKLENERILSLHVGGNSGRFVACTCSGKVLLYDMKQFYLTKEKRWHTKGEVMENTRYEKVKEPVIEQFENRLSDQTVERLKGIVKEFGTYPEKYRYLIWTNLLCLPGNDLAYAALASKGLFHEYKDIEARYPIVNKTLLRSLQRVLSMLSYWNPKFVKVDYLPLLAFPFVKLFHTNLQQCLEIIIVFICNWCQNWYFYFPKAPFNVFAAVENILSAHDSNLLLHFVRYGVTSHLYAWPILQTIFSEVFSRDEWLQLFDHIFSNEPSFLLYVVAALNILLKRDVMKCKTPNEFYEFYNHRLVGPPVKELIKLTYWLQSSSDEILKENVSCAMGSFKQIPSEGPYPLFENFPGIAINMQEENKQLQDEIEYFRRRQEILLGDTDIDTKNSCTCDGKRNAYPQLSQAVQNEIPRRRKDKKTEHLFEKQLDSSEAIKSLAPSALCTSRLQFFDTSNDNVHLKGKEVINSHHSDVLRNVLRTRRMVAKENLIKHHNVDALDYEML